MRRIERFKKVKFIRVILYKKIILCILKRNKLISNLSFLSQIELNSRTHAIWLDGVVIAALLAERVEDGQGTGWRAAAFWLT